MEEFIEGPNSKRLRKARRWVYEMFALNDGLTVQEFEELWGWEPYSLYPEARKAGPMDRGYELYGKRNAG